MSAHKKSIEEKNTINVCAHIQIEMVIQISAYSNYKFHVKVPCTLKCSSKVLVSVDKPFKIQLRTLYHSGFHFIKRSFIKLLLSIL